MSGAAMQGSTEARAGEAAVGREFAGAARSAWRPRSIRAARCAPSRPGAADRPVVFCRASASLPKRRATAPAHEGNLEKRRRLIK